MAGLFFTARTSTGGGPPRRSTYHPPRSVVTTDHDGDEIVHAWGPPAFSDTPDDLPPFPFPVYVTSEASSLSLGQAFAEKFALFNQESGSVSDGDDDCRFELYTRKQLTILHCVDHARKEILHRHENGIWPSSVERWCSPHHDEEPHYQRFLLVIDRDNWQEEGIIFVWYDPQHYELGESWQYWSSQEGDLPFLEATLHRDMKVIGGKYGHLWWPWNVARGHSLQDSLRKRNNELLSVAPNVTPELKVRFERIEEEVQDDEESPNHIEGVQLHDQEVEGHETNDDQNSQVQDDLEDEFRAPRIESTFVESELWDCSQHEDLCSKIYYDAAGSQVTSVWRKQHGNFRPPFSVTLYVTKDCPPFTPWGLFRCLNKGLLDTTAWTLDVVYDISDIKTALWRHNKESTLREDAATNSRRKTMRMLLVKIVGHVLPMELLQRVEEMLIAPPLLDYSALPERPHRNIFLFLPDGRSSHGPLLVYNNPAPGEYDKLPVRTFSANRPRHGSMGYKIWLQTILKVTDLRYWHRVANEIHIIWCRTAPRATLDTPIPILYITLSPPDTTITAIGNIISGASVTAEAKLEASSPVTIHKHPLFNMDLFRNALEIVDLTTGITLPRVSHVQLKRFNSSWDQSEQLGFAKDDASPQSDETECFLTLKPRITTAFSRPADIFASFFNDQLTFSHFAGLLWDGHEYALRQYRQDIVVPRWTWGHWHKRQGPYNMPPMPVVMEQEWRFKFECRRNDSTDFLKLCRCHRRM